MVYYSVLMPNEDLSMPYCKNQQIKQQTKVIKVLHYPVQKNIVIQVCKLTILLVLCNIRPLLFYNVGS